MLAPHGILWQVRQQATAFSEWETIVSKSREHAWQALQIQASNMANSIPVGSWTFVAFSIVHDGIYQAALYRLSHWLAIGKTLKDATSLARYVYGLHESLDALLSLPLQSPSRSITYPMYDVQKNAALAAMRFQTALSILVSIVDTQQQLPVSIVLDKSIRETLQKLVQNSDLWKEMSADAVLRVLPEMHARQDPDRDVFQDFVDRLISKSSPSNVAPGKEDRRSTANRSKAKRKKHKKSAKTSKA